MRRPDITDPAVLEAWDHNNHYHRLLLAALPPRVERALDVGCGLGFFAAKLARRATHVDAVDCDRDTVDAAVRLQGECENIDFICGDFLALGLPSERYDAVVSIASLHHMDLVPALCEMRRVLRPGGALAVLGLFREASLADLAVTALAVPAGFARRELGGSRVRGPRMTVPILPPFDTLQRVREAARANLPGAVVRRRLYWRYSLVWRKPWGG